MDLQTLKIQRNQPTRRTRGNPWPLRLTLLAGLGLAGWLFWKPLTGFADRMRLPEVRVFLVREAAAAAAASVRGTAANGYVVAARRAALSSDVPGRIVELNVREGSVVKQGEVVARLYADEYRASLARAAADLVAAEAGITRAAAAEQASKADLAEAEARAATAAAQTSEARALLKFAETERQRVLDLLPQGIGARRDQERAESERDAAAARLGAAEAAQHASETAADSVRERIAVAAADRAVAEAQRDVAKAARDLAQATLDKTDVRAPFDGIVVLKDAEVGEVVSPNVVGGGNSRGAVCTMVDFASLEIQANVPETTLSSVRLGAPADVFLDAWPDDRYEGTVDRIWPTADRQKATVEVRVKLAKPDQKLRPEMGVRIVFRDADRAEAVDASASRATIVVPENALVEVAGKTGAFVVERDVVRFAAVTTGERKTGRVAIDAGLTPGQRIVLDPPASLQDGGRVRLLEN